MPGRGETAAPVRHSRIIVSASESPGGAKFGLVLSGGGARGPFQVGVYERLLRDERFAEGPSVLSGTSAGALNAAMIASGFSPVEIMEFWFGLADDPPVVASARLFESGAVAIVKTLFEELIRLPMSLPEDIARLRERARHYWPPRPGSGAALLMDYMLTSRFDVISKILDGIREPYLADTGRLRERLVDLFGGTCVPAKKRLAINAVDINTRRVVRYVTGPVPALPASEYVVVPAITVDMLMASASIPLIFNPIAIGSHLLWDGGLLVNTPLAPAVALGADQIVTVLVTEREDPNEQLTHMGRAIERSLDAVLERLARETMGPDAKTVRVGDGVTVVMPGQITNVIDGFGDGNGIQAASVKLKRKRKMAKHKHRKRRKRDRNKG